MSETMASTGEQQSVAEALYVIDLDRTLIDTNKVFACFLEAAEEKGIDTAQLDEDEKKVKTSGGSFDVLTHVKGTYSEDVLNSVKNRFVGLAKERRGELLYDGAEELLGELKRQALPHVIATYGGEEWQTWKLEALGFKDDKDYIITDRRDKGRWIADDWKQDDGTYAPSFRDESGEIDSERQRGFRARTIILIDDKPESFEGLPEGSVSVLVCHGEAELLSQKGEIKAGTLVVDGLRRVLPEVKSELTERRAA